MLVTITVLVVTVFFALFVFVVFFFVVVFPFCVYVLDDADFSEIFFVDFVVFVDFVTCGDASGVSSS